MLGRTLGHYRIVQEIGQGGMGVVYLARDERLDRDVALKLLPLESSDRTVASKRLHAEALLLSRLNHPNIAQVYDFNVEDGVAFLVMEYVKGMTLASRLRDGALPEELATDLGIQVASALENASDASLIHRDIKPSNIMLTLDGKVKVLDFGLAKLVYLRETEQTKSQTEIADLAGTLPYMAPEQLRGDPADYRTDIYSLGCVLYEAATGKKPFVSATAAGLINEILNKQPAPPRVINSNISPNFEHVVLRCLAKTSARRYKTAGEVRSALESTLLSETNIKAIPNDSRFSVRAILSTALLTTVAMGIGFAIWRVPRRATIVHASAPTELAVLPVNLAGIDNETAAFENGLVETLTVKLAQLSENHPLQVVPASELRAKGISNLREANQEFGATLGLELDVQRSGQMIRVNYAVIDAEKHNQLRGGTITAPASDPFSLEDKVAESVVKALQIELSPDEQRILTEAGTTQAGAWDYYLQGRGYLQDFQKPENVENAITEFNHAVEHDPGYALAYAGLGEAFWWKYEFTKDASWVDQSKSACERSVALRNDQAAGHNCLGLLYRGIGAYEKAIIEYKLAAELQPSDDGAYKGQALAYEALGNMNAAEQTLETAISLRPNYWSNYNSLGEFYLKLGRYAEAEAMFTSVTQLVPDSFVGYGNLGVTYLSEGKITSAIPVLERSVDIRPTAENTSNLGTAYFQLRRYADSARTYEQATKLDDSSYDVWGNLGDAYYWSPGDRSKAASAYANAIRLGNEALQVNPRNADLVGYIAVYYAMLNEHGPAMRYVKKALAIPGEHPETLFSVAIVYNQFGNTEACFLFLTRAVKAGFSLATLDTTPNLDNLRSDPRFQNLVAQNHSSKGE